MLPFRDRSTVLAIVGALEVLAGLGIIALGALSAIVMMFPEARQAIGRSAGMAVVSGLTYVLLGAIVVASGAGLMAARRWGRALSLIGGWAWLVVGIATALLYIPLGWAMAPALSAGGAGHVPPVLITLVGCAIAVTVFIVPGGAVVGLLCGDDARLTCEWRDRHERWTDRCPLPVLGLALLLGFGAVVMFPLAFTYPGLVAGHVLRGPAATAFYLAGGLVAGVLAIGAYRLKPWAYWGSLAFYAASIVNGVTALRPDALRGFYAEMGLPAADVDLGVALVTSRPFLALTALLTLAFLAWIASLHRHFRPTEVRPIA